MWLRERLYLMLLDRERLVLLKKNRIIYREQNKIGTFVKMTIKNKKVQI